MQCSLPPFFSSCDKASSTALQKISEAFCPIFNFGIDLNSSVV